MIAENKLFTLVGVAALGWLLYLLAPILTPFIAAALLAYVGDPLVDRLQRLRMSRTFAVIVAFILITLVVAAMVLLVVPLARGQIGVLAEKLPGYVALAESKVLPELLALLGVDPSEGRVGLAAFIKDHGGQAAEWFTNALARVSRSSSMIVGAAFNLFLIPVLTFYLLRDWDKMVAAIGELVPQGSRERVFVLARESDSALGGFLRGQLMVMLGLSVIYSTGLAIVGLDFAFAIGVVAGIVSFVPYLGFIVGIALAGLTALAQAAGLPMLLGVAAVFMVGQVLESVLLTPRLVGDRIGLHPVLVIFAVMAGGQLFGFFGVLLGLPAAAVVSVIVRLTYQHYFDNPAGDKPAGATDT
ncbi:MAG: AI-2E family transporter [Pseudomonadota bacterium]